MAVQTAPVELIPPRRQTLWGKLAVANFSLGGLGAGLYVVAALSAGPTPAPQHALAWWLGPTLVLVGFSAVAAEAGRPLRGFRVLRQVHTSWMSRELWIGGAFAALALADLAWPGLKLRVLAVAAAVALALVQGCILSASRGVAAWNVATLPLVFLASSLLSGAGLLTLLGLLAGRVPSRSDLGGLLVLLGLGILTWLAYLGSSREPAFLRATDCLRDGRSGLVILYGGYLGPFLLAAVWLFQPGLAAPAAALMGVLLVASQALARFSLILEAGHLRPITLPGLRLTPRSP